ncbi:adenylate/guanylate cyclase domain-containing protein [Mycobacterium paraterrae]|uniref:Adenylate/guanylate cyclase domain-containing protein n=1 Tax=Mycobacterium paraterrae TaxID=577492 RepID=A0ABY3VQ76_9MYCO|nr:adenylate/guanylate cyclase domain-containing protein [Mycobacterium paraterrae]UMB71597.1 adenylate/guanylate cyclase domain-containing protein [Mycobacterium paraterrae]
MVDSLDFEAIQAAGIADAQARAGLLEYLASLGFTVDDMAQAERRGRLFGLAGDALLQSGPQTFTLRTAAQSLAVPVTDVEYAWAMLGLTVEDSDTPALTQADVDALGTWIAMRARLGHDAADGYMRVLGAALARLAEAVSSMIRTTTPRLWLGSTGDELATAQAYREVAGFVPRLGSMLDAIHRHHLVSTRTFIEGVERGPSSSILCGVGFADLSGFTALTQTLTPAELSSLLTEFGAAVSDMVHADGGRVVKFLGDAVMWVSPQPERLATAALDLVRHPRARDAGLQVRAGLAYGPILTLNGDYFGNAVNLAARLVAAAAPGQILVSAEVFQLLPDWPAVEQEPLLLKGFDSPVVAYELDRSGSA